MYYLVFDLEMTGTDPGWHEIIQIGACLFDEEWNELGQYLQNVYPENEESFSIPALEVHGLTMEELDEAPMISEVLPAFEEWILKKMKINTNVLTEYDRPKFLRRVICCGQSVVNDINFLKFAYRQEKLKWPFSHQMLDLHSLSYYLFMILKNNGENVPRSRSLESVARYFGYERAGHEHNALEDAVLTAKCLKEVFEYAYDLELVDEEEN